MNKVVVSGLTAVALLSCANLAMADGSSAQVTLSATVTGNANINVASSSASFPSTSISAIIAGNGGSITPSNIIMYNDANPTNGYDITVTSQYVDGSGNPLLQNSNGASAGQIPMTLAITSCGTGTALTFPSGYGSASSSVTGNNATSAACAATPGTIGYTLGTPSSSITTGTYSDQLTLSIQQL